MAQDVNKGINKGRVEKAKAKKILTRSKVQMEVINKEAFENNKAAEMEKNPTVTVLA